SLRITDIDPLKYKLVFERFLTIERISMPDFDIDFANEGREEVIRYVIEKYGRDQVGQIITFGTLGAKAVIKDVARTLGISIPESEMISKLIPKDPKINLEKAFTAEPRLRELEQDPRYTELCSLARTLEGLHRHSSIHAAGVVIGKSALHNFVPLFKDPKTGGIATQYSMNFLETCGLVKMDFLGLKTLDVIKRTEELIRGRGGEYRDFNIENISESGTPESEAVFKMLSEGKSFEIFQFESEGMQNILKQAKPGRLEDLIALNALYRPGPMDSIPQFIESKNGQRAIEYPAAGLEPILKETYGVITYQEQVMQVAQVLAGYTLGQADLLRRAMGKKKQEVMDKEKERFIEGAVKQGYQPETAGKVFDLLAPFAGYGFNKCHAAAYSVLAYQTAYLKANFPAEFMAANLSNEIHSADKDKLSECIDEARKMGLAIDPPDINRSGKLFTVAEGRIIYGFLGIKGLGDGPAEEIVKGRAEGPYRDFMDFLQRADIKAVGKKVVELLIQTGAFDSLSPGPGRAPEQGLGQNRGILLGNLEKAADYVRNIKDEKKFGQASLFGETGEKEYPDFVFEPFPGTTREEMLRLEKELIGFYFSGHPMDEYREIWQKMVKADLGKPEKLRTGNCILVGIIKSLKTIVTGRGDKMAFATLADYRGEIEVTFFARAWEKCGDRVEPDKVAILRGKIEYQKDKDHYSFIAEEWINASEADEAAKEEEARERKWDKFRNIWMYAADLKSGDLGKAAKGNYTAVGLLKSLREFKDKKGNGMAFGTLQDYEGEIPLVFFARVWAECRDLLTPDEMVALKGSIDPAGDRNPEKPGFKVTSLADMAALGRLAAKRLAAEGPPDEGGEEARKNPEGAQNGPPAENKAPETLFREIHIRLGRDAADEDAALYPLHDCLVDNPGPCSVFIHVPLTGGETVIRTASQINASAAAISIDALKQCAGVAEVWGV
ncbi:MAG: DNA polymerase III subunit alpha, partial [Treponema sp.]|nr:DNA polymerase III subunit alpha [Treponema sp.]